MNITLSPVISAALIISVRKLYSSVLFVASFKKSLQFRNFSLQSTYQGRIQGGGGGGGGLMVMRGAWLKGAIEVFNYHLC